jgi:hypothetical protein
MATTYRLTPRAHLLLAIEALKFAMEQQTVSAQTRRKIALTHDHAPCDLTRLQKKTARVSLSPDFAAVHPGHATAICPSRLPRHRARGGKKWNFTQARK